MPHTASPVRRQVSDIRFPNSIVYGLSRVLGLLGMGLLKTGEIEAQDS